MDIAARRISIDPSARAPSAAGERRFDYLIVGGGLAGGLVALALAARRPRASVALVEQGPLLGGHHTWSFHDGDLPDQARAWVEPLVAHHWSGHEVRFPDGARRFSGGYATITSSRFDQAVRARLTQAGFAVMCETAVVEVGRDGVRTADGRVLHAAVVLDARGLPPSGAATTPAGAARATCGYQKFVGLEVELAKDGGLGGPILMDATVEQLDGFRFVYVLPFGPRRWLVEDTYYADTPALDRARLRARILAYLRAHGHSVVEVAREEAGVLPLPFHPAPVPVAPASALPIGYRGGWYHPVTGYSFPVAVRLALAITQAADPTAVAAAVSRAWTRHARQARFSHWLTRMMFTAVAPERRWRLLARFYRLPAPTIERFYALRMTLTDRVRLLAGWPPRWPWTRSATSTSVSSTSASALEEVS